MEKDKKKNKKKKSKTKDIPITREIVEVIEHTEEKNENKYTRNIQISTLNTQVIVTSEDPNDSLKTIKDMAVELINRYTGRDEHPRL